MNKLKQRLCALLCTTILIGTTGPALRASDFTNDMKLTVSAPADNQLSAASIERQYDHPDSPQAPHPDFYHMKSTASRTMLSGYKTFQQTSEWSCGPAAALTVLQWYGRADGWDEQKLADLRHPLKDVTVPGFPNGYPGTTLRQMKDIFDGVGGFHYISSSDYQKEGKTLSASDIRQFLSEGPAHPGLLLIDWSGHWQAIIGYDDMGTANEADDVIIVSPIRTIQPTITRMATASTPGKDSNRCSPCTVSSPKSEGGNQLFLIPIPDKVIKIPSILYTCIIRV